MAVHFATVADYAQRTSGLLPATGSSTVMLWVKFDTVSVLPAYQTPYIIIDDPGTYTDYVAFFGDTTDLRLDGNMTPVTTMAPTAATWYHLCWVQSGTTQSFYVNGDLVGSETYNRAAVVQGFELLGNDTFSDGDLDCAYFRSWSGSALTEAQIQIEMQATTAVITTNLWMDTPLTSDLNDVSGNGRNWTGVGAHTFVASPTFLSNNSALTATEITGYPKTLTVDFGDGLFAWYKITGRTNEVVVGWLALADLTNDRVLTQAFSAPASSPTVYPQPVNIGIAPSTQYNRAVQIPVASFAAENLTVYLKVSSENFTKFTQAVTIDIQLQPSDPAPRGSLYVNDVNNGYPMALLPAGGSSQIPLQFVRFPGSDVAAVLPTSGIILTDDTVASTLRLFQPDLTTVIANIAYPVAGTPTSISSNQVDTFYVGFKDGSTLHVCTVSDAGVVGGTTWSPTVDALTVSLNPIAVSLDDTTLYYGSGQVGKSQVRRWDLIGNTALADLSANVVGAALVPDLLVMQDGNIIIGRRTSGFALTGQCYSSAGALLHSYTFTNAALASLNRMCHALDDPNSFWGWFFLKSGATALFESSFHNIKVSDGSTIGSTQFGKWFDGGIYSGTSVADPPVADPLRFGHSKSCAVFVGRSDIAAPVIPPTPPTPGGETVTEYLIRRERWFPHLSHEQFRQFFSMLQIDLQAGNGLGGVPSTTVGFDPLLEIDWSDDGGWTWSSLRFAQSGKIGAYTQRAIVRRLGYGRDRVFRIACTDPVQFCVINGYLQAVLGTS